jgi:hypothetical protein
MIENDFPVFRETVEESVIGRSVAWLLAAVTVAAADAAVTKRVAVVRSAIDMDTAAAIRMGGIAIAVAGVASWGLSQFVPRYVATAIPDVALLAAATLSALVVWRADSIAEQWQSSRLRRLIK